VYDQRPQRVSTTNGTSPLIKAADQLGWSQEKLNRFVQANAMDIFQIEAKKRNLRHAYEEAGNDVSALLDLMKDF
jgi:broad-specificity NMP kinase